MNSNEIFQASRIVRVRELRGELAAAKAELTAVRAELEQLKSHFALAVAAARDVAALPPGGELLIVDGWNAVFNGAPGGAPPERRDNLLAAARAYAAANPSALVWLVFDGPDASAERAVNLRVSYTGGGGEHRADRLICDFLRMLKFSGGAVRARVCTNDRDFAAEARRLGAGVVATAELWRDFAAVGVSGQD